jgi:hypothetical protein
MFMSGSILPAVVEGGGGGYTYLFEQQEVCSGSWTNCRGKHFSENPWDHPWQEWILEDVMMEAKTVDWATQNHLYETVFKESCLVWWDNQWNILDQNHHLGPSCHTRIKSDSMTWKYICSPTKLKTFHHQKNSNNSLLGCTRHPVGGFSPKGQDIQCSPLLWYTENKLKEAVHQKRPGKMWGGVIILHSNVTPHTAWQTQHGFQRYGWDVSKHPAHTPDFAPSDFNLLGLSNGTCWAAVCEWWW